MAQLAGATECTNCIWEGNKVYGYLSEKLGIVHEMTRK